MPDGYDVAVGIFQIQITANEPPEWGFVIGSEFWGTGLFVEGAVALMDFAFNQMGLERLAARAAVDNGRGNGALRKIGAVRKSRIRNGLVRAGRSTTSITGRRRRRIGLGEKSRGTWPLTRNACDGGQFLLSTLP